MLSDAGVELGANYERPIVDEAEALQNLQAARAVVEQSLPWGTPPEAMPYRQASVAQHGPTFRPASEPPSNQPPLSRCTLSLSPLPPCMQPSATHKSAVLPLGSAG